MFGSFSIARDIIRCRRFHRVLSQWLFLFVEWISYRSWCKGTNYNDMKRL